MSIHRRIRRGAVFAGSALLLASCSVSSGRARPAVLPEPETEAKPALFVPPPVLAPPADSDGVPVWEAARKATGKRIVVSTEKRWLWLMQGKDTLLSAPVAVGMGRSFEFEGKKYHFTTPRGRRRVVSKEENPIWTVPEWHYLEKAAHRGLEVVRLQKGQSHTLSDGSIIEVRDDQVGRVNTKGQFWPWTPGMEIIFDGKIFIPPFGTAQRKVPNALGPVKLDTGNGYLIHGTHVYNEKSIGEAVSHGCVRMRNEDVLRLYELVEPGTPVYIY